MANGVNRVTLVGNLGRDPEVQNFDNNVKKVTFSLATTERQKKEGQKVDHTEWHNIVLWGALGEIAEKYLKKGSMIFLEGKIRRRDYEDKEKQKRFIYEIVGDNMVMLGGGPRRDAGTDGGGNETLPDPIPDTTPGDDLPF